MSLSLHQLPIDIIYRIFDHLNEKHLFMSTSNINRRLNTILDSYQRFQKITTLFLWNNQIGDAGAQVIAQALQRNQTLTTLDLESNRIGDIGVRAIAQTLQTNQTLITLRLYYNEFGDTVPQAIVQALRRNETLTGSHAQDN